jgi:hypothetical protein
MKRNQIAIIALALVLSCNTARANKFVIGSGVETCGGWTRSNPGMKTQRIAWVLGFLSGVNFVVEPDILKGPDAAAIEGWMDNYCRQHPLDTMVKAASDLSVELVKRAVGANADVKQK